MPGPDQLTEGLVRVAATADETRLPGTDAVRRRGEQRTRRQRLAAIAAAACVVAGGALGANALLGGGDPQTVPAAPPPTASAPPTSEPSPSQPSPSQPSPSQPSPSQPSASATPRWPQPLTRLDPGTDVWLVLLTVSPDADDPAFAAAAERHAELTPYGETFAGPDQDLTSIREVAAADPAVVAACPAVVGSPWECWAQSVTFATEADAQAFVDLYADPVLGPFPWNTGSLD